MKTEHEKDLKRLEQKLEQEANKTIEPDPAEEDLKGQIETLKGQLEAE